MSTDLSYSILNFIGESGKPLSALDICRVLGNQVGKSQVNSILYGLLSSGRVNKIDGSPPRWSIKLQGEGASHPSSFPTQSFPTQYTLETREQPLLLSAQIIQERLGDREISAKDLAKELGSNKKTINSMLSGMEKQSMVTKSGSTPPLWKQTGEKEKLSYSISLKLNNLHLEQLQAVDSYIQSLLL